MTLSPAKYRFSSFVAALAVTWLLVFVGPVSAADARSNNIPYFQVELAAETDKDNGVVSGVYVACVDRKCVAPKANSSHKNFCSKIAKEHGEITAFVAGKRVFDAKQLAKCNRNIAK